MRDRREKSAELAADVAEFLARGGRVNEVPFGESGEKLTLKYIEDPKRSNTGYLKYVDKEQSARLQNKIMTPKSRRVE